MKGKFIQSYKKIIYSKQGEFIEFIVKNKVIIIAAIAVLGTLAATLRGDVTAFDTAIKGI